MKPNQSKYRSESLSDSFEGRIPPHDTELEKALLGAMLLEQSIYYEVAGIVTSDIFYHNTHAVIFRAIKSLADENKPVDLFTISQKLKIEGRSDEVGGPAYLATLTQTVGSAAHAQHHALILYQMHVMRTMAWEFSALAAKCYDTDFDSVSTEYQTVLARMDSMFSGSGREKHISAILKRHGQLVEERMLRAGRNEIQGLRYGLTDLDRLTGGMQRGQLIIVAARSAMGKTAIALKFAKSPALDGAHVTIASLEMTDLSLTDRLISSYASVDGWKLRSGRMDHNDLRCYERAASELARLNISIDDTAGTTPGRLSAMARTKKRKGELDLLIIDYLQLIESDADKKDFKRNREQEVATITRGLKKLAKDIEIPVVLLCQLNRAVESRKDKLPQLYDLRESGGIEQDADVVLMPFRPAYYGSLEFEDDNGTVIPDDAGVVFLRKQRDGALGAVNFRYSPDLSKIEDYTDAEEDSDTLF